MHLQRNKKNVRKRIAKKAMIALLLLIAPVLLFLFTFSLKKVEVEGSERYTDKQIKGMLLQSKVDYNSLLFFFKYNYVSKPNIPFIEKMDFELAGLHEVSITVYEKKIAGCVKFMGEYLYFDKDGIVVESSSNKIKGIPIIDGLQFKEIILHHKLKVKDDALYGIIMSVTNLINKYDLDVDSITFGKNNEVTLFCGEVRVLMGKKDYYDEVLSDLKSILLKSEGTGLYELDMKDYTKDSRYVIGKTNSNKDGSKVTK